MRNFTFTKISYKTGENSDKGFMLETDVSYAKEKNGFYSDISFFPNKMKINNMRNLYVIFLTRKAVSYT